MPVGRIRTMREAVVDPQVPHRAVLHRHAAVEAIGGPLTVPVAAFRLHHGSPSVETPPRPAGADTDAVLREAGFTPAEIVSLRDAGDI